MNDVRLTQYCRVCNQDMMCPPGERRVHFVKTTDRDPCPGSWPEKRIVKP